jgi:hypothetical protein
MGKISYNAHKNCSCLGSFCEVKTDIIEIKEKDINE